MCNLSVSQIYFKKYGAEQEREDGQWHKARYWVQLLTLERLRKRGYEAVLDYSKVSPQLNEPPPERTGRAVYTRPARTVV